MPQNPASPSTMMQAYRAAESAYKALMDFAEKEMSSRLKEEPIPTMIELSKGVMPLNVKAVLAVAVKQMAVMEEIGSAAKQDPRFSEEFQRINI